MRSWENLGFLFLIFLNFLFLNFNFNYLIIFNFNQKIIILQTSNFCAIASKFEILFFYLFLSKFFEILNF